MEWISEELKIIDMGNFKDLKGGTQLLDLN
jgi:hypothetical protein